MKLFVCTLVTMVVIAMLIDDTAAWWSRCKPTVCPKNCKYGVRRWIQGGCTKCGCQLTYIAPLHGKRGEGLEEEERSLQDELDQKLDARESEGLEEEVRSLLDVLEDKLDARELEGLEEEDYARRRR
ncbi:uncharacterized protein [Branchiostoma lanceolatum]|uniref:uncharacterized protein n=1 Tax=Branchiostoma lanceolatum TaxID=7740 RepID=UPI00345625AD